MNEIDKLPKKNRSIRHCLSCEKNTVWGYDPGVFHSRCTECGALSLFSTKPKKNGKKKWQERL